MYKTARIDLQGVQDYIKDNWKDIRCAAQSAAANAFTAYLLLTTKEPADWVTSWNAANLAHDTISDWINCGDDPVKYEEEYPESTERCGCVEFGGRLWCEFLKDGEGEQRFSFGGTAWVKEILEVTRVGDIEYCRIRTVKGTIESYSQNLTDDYVEGTSTWYIQPQNGGACCGEKPPEVDPVPPPPPTPIIETDECIWTVQQIAVAYQDNIWEWKKYLVEPNFSPCGAPFCYWEGPDGATFDTDCNSGPPWGSGGGGSDCGCGLSAVTYTQNIGCTWNEEENDYDMKFSWVTPSESNGILGLAKRLDAIALMIDVAGLIPYRLCNEKPKLEGDWVTTRWVSDEKSFESGRRLRKLLRYRSKSSRNLAQLSSFWEDFTWRAGPVCVRHTGAWWGDPQVWAESEEEGQRVLRRAGSEAGIDPDKTGRWGIGSSRSPRIGMPGTMRIHRLKGFPWVASRDGSNWPNQLAQMRDP